MVAQRTLPEEAVILDIVRQEMLEAMRKGDTVVTTGGIRGKVVGFSDSGKIVRIEIAKGVEVDVVRSRIDAVGKLPDAEQGK